MKNYLVLLFMAILFFSCEKEEITELNPNTELRENEMESIENISSPELAFPEEKGEIITFPQKDGSEIVIEKFGNTYVWMGDIILSKEQVDILRSQSLAKGAGISSLTRHWPNSIVYFRISPSLPNQARITQAINHYNTVAPYLTFIQRTDQSNYIEFVPGAGCSSFVGMTGGRQVINLAPGCGTGAVIHEIGHALGLFHEQARTDRNNFIRVNFNNIEPGREHNFQTYAQRGYSGFNSGVFDFNSIMMYSSTAFSVNGQPTIERTNGQPYFPNTTTLSAGDRNILFFLYGAFAKIEREVVESYQEYDGYAGYDIYSESAYYVRFYADRNHTTPMNLPRNVSFKYKIKSRPTSSNGSPSGVSTSNRTRNLTAGSNRYFLTNVVEEDCSYEFGDPVDTCYDRYLEFSRGLGYQIE